MAIYPVSTLYPGNTDAYPGYSTQPWSYGASTTSTYGGTAVFNYSGDQEFTYR